MARPCKSAKVLTECSQTKEEINARIEHEDRLRGSGDKLAPPKWLSESQKEIFINIVSELRESEILGNLDIYILSQCSVAIDRLQTIEQMINADPNLLSTPQFMSSKEKYTKDFYRCCNELSLSPQSRAKMANINLMSKKDGEDPLLAALRDDD